MGFYTAKCKPKGIGLKLILIPASLVSINCQASSSCSLWLGSAVQREHICLPGSWPNALSQGGTVKDDPVTTLPDCRNAAVISLSCSSLLTEEKHLYRTEDTHTPESFRILMQ